MYGVDGWCRGCGTPVREQTGPLTIQGRGFPTAEVWMPNWMFDVVCVSAEVAAGLQDFKVETRDVHKPRGGATGVKQLVAQQCSVSWYSPPDLKRAVLARHRQHNGDRTGAACATCERWRWLPVSEGEVVADLNVLPEGTDLVASPEIFGDGWASRQHLLFRRELADYLVSANPTVWSVVELPPRK
jgi:hypothetical protein